MKILQRGSIRTFTAIILTISLILLYPMMVFGNFNVFPNPDAQTNEEKVTLTIPSSTQFVNVDLSTDTPGIMSGTFMIKYNPSIITLVDVLPGIATNLTAGSTNYSGKPLITDLGYGSSNANGATTAADLGLVNFQWGGLDSGDPLEAGKLGTLKFSVKGTGETSINLQKIDNDTPLFSDAGGDPLDVGTVTPGTITVTAASVDVQSVALDENSTSIAVGSSKTLTATVSPDNATNKNVTWSSSDSSKATVNASGVVTGVAVGTSTITVTTEDGSKTATCVVTVTQPVTGVTLNKNTTTIVAGQKEILTATVEPTDATNKNVTWSTSDEAVATVNSSGEVTAVAAGTATITVISNADPSKTATCTVTVNPVPVPVESVSLDKSTSTIEAGATDTLTATVNPSNATDKTVTWTSSNTNVATVNNGVVTGVAAGTATITVKSNYDVTKTATSTVTITAAPISVTGVSLNKTTDTIAVGSTDNLTATITPPNATSNLTWSSSNFAVASVSASGVVTGVAEGTATITVTTDNGKFAECVVNVVYPVTSVALNKSASTIAVDATDTLTATITPTNATNKNVTWTSSNTAVAIVSNGVVTGVAPGTATITVESNADPSKTASCDVTVIIPVDSVSLNASTMNLIKGQTGKLTATIDPTNATNKTVTWSSTKPDVATVDANGTVTAKTTGETTIIVTTDQGGKTAECVVNVTKKPFVIAKKQVLTKNSTGVTGAENISGVQVSVEVTKIDDYTTGDALVVFVLMDSNNTPKGIHASQLTAAKDVPQKETSIFSVSAAGTYTVNVYVLDKFDTDLTSAPLSLIEVQ